MLSAARHSGSSLAPWMTLVAALVVAPGLHPVFAQSAADAEYAADDDLGDIDLLDLTVPMVVTASRHKRPVYEVPYAIGVVDARDIRASGARTIADALRLIPGVDVADISMSNQAVSPRAFQGLVANQTLVLVDGRQVFDAVFGGTLWGSWPFQLEDIERIEVIRGPGSVTWGANAVTGVINVITKDPADQLGWTLSIGGGSRGMVKQHTSYARQDGDRLRYRVSAEYDAGDGFHGPHALFSGPDEDHKAGRMGLHMVFDLRADETLTLSMGSGVVDGGYPRMSMAGISTDTNAGSQASYVMASWSQARSAGEQLEIKLFANDFQVTPGVTIIDYRYQQFAAQFGHRFRAADAHELVWGIDTRLDLLDTGNTAPFMLTRDFVSSVALGMYIQDTWKLAPKWNLDLGLRLDYESYTGFQPSARVALSRTLDDHGLIYGAVSRAFQVPAIGMRFLNIPSASGLIHVTSNRHMAAPSLLAYEVGYRGHVRQRLQLGANVYWHEHRNMILRDTWLGPPGLIQLRFDSRVPASVYGVELSAGWDITNRLKLLGHYTYAGMDWRTEHPLVHGDVLTLPKHKAMLGVRYSPTDDVHLSGHLHFVDEVQAPDPGFPLGRLHVDDYLRLDLRGEFEFDDDRASIAIGVRNLLDPSHTEGTTAFLSHTEVPRMVYAELHLHIE